MFDSSEAGHGAGNSLSEFADPLQSSGGRRHVLLHRHDARVGDGAHLLVVQLLGEAQLVVHHRDHLGVVLVEVLPDEWPVQQRTQNVDQLRNTQTRQSYISDSVPGLVFP